MEMEFYTLLSFGCLVGMQHALEADHLTAVAAMSTGRLSRHALVLRGGFWGLGHTITLLAICGVLLVAGKAVSPRTEAVLEALVGVMLIVLGAGVLRSLWKKRPHLHVHEHAPGVRHLHWHTHSGDTPHSQSPHRHGHADIGLVRALTVGMMHGAAGSAGLLVLAATADSIVNALGYVLAFGAGSIIGMAALSFVASFPLKLMEHSAGWFNTAAVTCIGCSAVFIGGGLIVENWTVALP
jgi:sulfite exporter TauE/SafE